MYSHGAVVYVVMGLCCMKSCSHRGCVVCSHGDCAVCSHGAVVHAVMDMW